MTGPREKPRGRNAALRHFTGERRGIITIRYHHPTGDEPGMTVNAVYKAKSRVLRRLRQELGELLD